MKVHPTKEYARMISTKLHFTVSHPITNRSLYSVEMTVHEAQEAIDYLREHNGDAPEVVKALIDGMEIACGLVWYE